MHPLLAVCLKELRETLRDPNAFLMSVLFPLLAYPMMVWGGSAWMEYRGGQNAGEQAPIAVVDGVVGGELAAILGGIDGLALRTVVDPEAALAEGTVVAVVDGSGEVVRTRWRSDLPASDRARARIDDALAAERARRVAAEVAVHGLPAGAADIEVITFDVGNERGKRELAAWVLSLLLPMVLVFNALIAVLYPAIEVAVGERERGTLETTLVAAVPRSAVIGGKLLSVLAIVLIANAVNLAAFLLSLWQLLQLMDAPELFAIPTSPWVWLGLLAGATLAAMVLASAVIVASLRARDFKQAQNISMILLMFAYALAMAGGLEGFTEALALVPIANLVVAMREAVAGRSPSVLPAVAENLAIVGMAVVFAARRVAGESWTFGARAPRGAP